MNHERILLSATKGSEEKERKRRMRVESLSLSPDVQEDSACEPAGCPLNQNTHTQLGNVSSECVANILRLLS